MDRTIAPALLCLLLSACASAPATTTTTTPPAGPSAALVSATRITAFAVSIENLNVDKVGLRDGYQKPDGARDLAFTTSIQGPVDAIFVVSTNAKGEPGYGLRADTLLANEEIPPELGGVIDTGKMTNAIGVVDTATGRFVNAESGSCHLPDGVHNLSLYTANTAMLTPGSFVRIYVKAGASLVPGPVAPY